jgi:hypothetical protein
LVSVAEPVIRPVDVSKFRPAGRVPTNEYEVTAAPVDEIVYPTSEVVATRVSEVLENVNAGAVLVTVNVNVLAADPEALVAVIVYTVAL